LKNLYFAARKSLVATDLFPSVAFVGRPACPAYRRQAQARFIPPHVCEKDAAKPPLHPKPRGWLDVRECGKLIRLKTSKKIHSSAAAGHIAAGTRPLG
jgi:hypothetical protein